ncbi:MAG: hypothetical protein MZV64_09955 [Ignavibacteriales bacterium]|nr:hypothetical protein [Ignavibacteriales bacterium]
MIDWRSLGYDADMDWRARWLCRFWISPDSQYGLPAPGEGADKRLPARCGTGAQAAFVQGSGRRGSDSRRAALRRCPASVRRSADITAKLRARPSERRTPVAGTLSIDTHLNTLKPPFTNASRACFV